MSHIALRCTSCDAQHAADMLTLGCRECGSPLDVWYLDAGTGTGGEPPPGWSGHDIPLPHHRESAWVSLGEGNTPRVELPAVGRILGLDRLEGKLEFLNPTGSFKDRGSAVMVTVAREHGVTELVEDSSGNAGASVAAYSARAGITAHIFAPAAAPQAKLRQIVAYGAEVHPVDGTREATTQAAVAYYTERRLVYASHALSPYYLEGAKTFAYEVGGRSRGALPGHIVFPVGNGSLLLGTWIGFKELLRAGHVPSIPRLHCVQARAVMPAVAGYRGENWSPDASASTVAGGIAVATPARLQQVLAALRETDGVAVAVDDPQITRWQTLLATQEGVYAEPTSAAAFAGLERLVADGVIGSDDPVLVPITGFGLKDVPPA